MKCYITVGVSASGKTKWAREKAIKNFGKTVITNRDDLRFSLTGANTWGEYNFNKKIETLITNIQKDVIGEAAACQLDVIVADTNLNKKYREELIAYVKGLKYDVEIVEFDVSIEEAWKRDSLRINGVGHSVIAKQYEQWLDYKGYKRYIPDSSKPKAILCDLDGTLAHMHGRNPFEWDKVDTDLVDNCVKDILANFKNNNTVIILSGRDSCCSDKTREWLKNNEVDIDYVFMRKSGDTRKDNVVKEEIFWQHIANNYNVQFVIDDRPQVTRLWNKLGLKVINMNQNPWIEF